MLLYCERFVSKSVIAYLYSSICLIFLRGFSENRTVTFFFFIKNYFVLTPKSKGKL